MTVAIPGMDLDGERVECQPHNGKLSAFNGKGAYNENFHALILKFR